MAFKALNLTDTHEVILNCDPDQEDPTVWIVRPLSSRELARCKDVATSFKPIPGRQEMDAQFNPNQSAYEVVRSALVDVRNYRDEKDQPTKWEKSFLDMLPLEALRELSERVEELCNVSVEEAKPSAA